MFSSKRALTLAVAAAAILAAPTLGRATTYNLTVDNCSSGGCGPGGTVTVTTESPGVLEIDVELTGSLVLHSNGLHTLGFNLAGVTAADITDMTSGGTGFTFLSNAMMDGSGSWDDVITLTGCTGTAGTCGQSLSFDVTTSSTLTANTDLTKLIFFGVNVAANNGNGNTGVEGATLAATPLPGAAMLFGSVLFGGLGVSTWRKRRGRSAASIMA